MIVTKESEPFVTIIFTLFSNHAENFTSTIDAVCETQLDWFIHTVVRN